MILNPVLYIPFALVFGLFAFIHSLMATNWFKDRASIIMRGWYKYYRILYNVVSMITFVPVILIWALYSGHAPLIYSAPQFLHLPLYAVQAVCLGAGVLTFLGTDPLEFVGIESKKSEKGRLVTTGLYGVVRHPLYLCIVVFLWAEPVFNLLYLLAVLLFTAYFAAGAFLEERRLVEEFGEEYRRYQEGVPMFLPLKIFK